MKTIEVDEDLYRFIASHTQHIGESASDILRRMLKCASEQVYCSSAAPVTTHENMATTPSIDDNLASAIESLIASDQYLYHKKAVDRFMAILSTLYLFSPDAFETATESHHGRTRRYFATDEQTLLQSGTRTKPKRIPGTPWWVITNTNTGRKCGMVDHLMRSMQLPAVLAERVCVTLTKTSGSAHG